jgi:outer membrane protein OmpU
MESGYILGNEITFFIRKTPMKKILLATAAIALMAPAVAHADIKLDLGGYFKGYAGYANQDVGGTKDVDLKRKAQVFFIGETTLDNGLTVGYNGQLMQESDVDSTTATGGASNDAKVEQSYLYFSGNWGRMNIGRENGAAYLLQVSAPGADSNLDGMDIAFSFFNQGTANVRQDYGQSGAGTVAGFRGENFQYADKITYLTPKLAGFQAGISYAPSVRADNTDSYFGMPSDATPGGYDDLLDAGLRYDGEFSGIGLHAGGGYTSASLEAQTTGLPVGATAQDDYKEWNAGLKLTFDGFGVGGAYNSRDGGLDTAGLGDVDTWVGGVDYTYGAYTFGASYLNSQGDALLGGTDKFDRWMLGAGYTFGPGMKFNGSIGFDDLKPAATTGADNKATVLAIGTDVQF